MIGLLRIEKESIHRIKNKIIKKPKRKQSKRNNKKPSIFRVTIKEAGGPFRIDKNL
jgi:hypothetical protein